ncbi:hypothetical protein WA158_003146 [Blastocystis sp. Blastoise]
MKQPIIFRLLLFQNVCSDGRIGVQACSSNEQELIVQRNYMKNAGEITQLYSGESTNLRNSLAFYDESIDSQDSVVDYKVCLDGNTNYSLELSSMNSSAWIDGSFVSLMYNKIILVNSRVNADDNGKKIIKFNLSSLLSSRMHWKYSTTVDAASWKENKIEEWGEDYKNKEIKNAGSSVYFRKDITIDDSFSVLQLSIQSQSGFIVYVNGIQMYTYLLPESSNTTQYTPSQSLEDVPTYKHIIVPKELLASSVSLTTLKIAIETHTTVDHPELLSSFDALTYISNSKDSIDTLSMLASRRLQDIPQYTMNAFEENQSIDFSAVLSLSLSNCVLSTDLPTGLTLSSNGILSGNPKEVVNTQYTLSYNFGVDGSSSNTYIFNLQILCHPISCSHIRVNRSTTYDASYEKVIIKSEDGNEISSLTQGNNLNQNYDYYGPVGTWSFELIKETSGIWNDDSIMTLYVIDDLSSTSIPVTKMRTIYKSHETYYINTKYSMLMKSEWKYNCYNSIPTEWYGSSVDDSTWPTINGGTAITPTATNQYFVFRKTINTPSIVNQKYFILSYKTVSNTKIFINNHELATHGFIDGYFDLTDASAIIEQTATGPLSLFDNQETITISVLLFDKQHIIDISFDASLLMVVDNNLPVYGDYDITINNCGTQYAKYIMDINPHKDTYMYCNQNSINPIVSIRSKDGHKYINRYCVTISLGIFYDSPKSWTVESIDVNGNRHIHSTVSDGSNYPYEYYRKCFFLSDVYSGINTLEFTFANDYFHEPTTRYYIGEIELFVDDITSDTLPSLSTSSNPYIAYDNTTISISFMNAEYYHDFTITPSLPDGITFNTNTGSIYGIIHGTEMTIDYTIRATSIFSIEYKYILTIHIQSCILPRQFINAQMNYDNDNNYSLRIYNYYSVFDMYAISHKRQEGSEDYNLCLVPGYYSVYLYKSTSSSTTTSYIYINNKLYQKLIFFSCQFTLEQFVDSSLMPIIYSYDNITPPKHWNTNLFNDNLWSTVPSSSSLPDVPSDSITQYYKVHYTIDSMPVYISYLNITVSTYAGMIIYINGIEIRRVNMEDSTKVSYNTLATSEYNHYKSFESIINILIDPNIIFVGDNVIAIEIHKYKTILESNENVNIKIEYVSDINSFDGEWFVNGEIDPDYPLSNLFDDNTNTYTIINRECVNSIFNVTFNNEAIYNINKYIIRSRNQLSSSYRPISFVLEGSNNHGNTWFQLDSQTGLSSTGYNKNYELPTNIYSYNSYRLRITECGIDDSITENNGNKVVLSDLSLFSKDFITCKYNGWTFSPNKAYSYKICPKGHTSNSKRYCNLSLLEEIIGDNDCIKINPSVFYMKETSIIMVKGRKYEQYYTIDGVDVDIHVSSLPNGITLYTDDQKISGIPTTISDNTTYTVYYKNNGIDTKLSEISVIVKEPFCERDGLWPQTNDESIATIPCPQYYEGSYTRYCNYYSTWEEPNTNECIYTGNTICTGTAYYNGNECEECINGYVTSFKGNNYLCTLCNKNEFVYKNQCVSKDAICTTITIDSSIYPDTKVGMIAVANCTNENQYGYYQVLCDYINNTPTWSNDINKDLCYPKPVSIPGKALETLDYSMKLKTTIDDIYSLLESLARTFVNTFKYQLTDLLLTTDYITGDDSINSFFLHAYYGSSIDMYSSSKPQLYINTITSSPTSLFYPESSLTNSITTTNEGYCQYDDSNLIKLNIYYEILTINNDFKHFDTLFCKQNKLDYNLISILTRDILFSEVYQIKISFDGIELSWINPDTFITIYRSILMSTTSPITQLQLNSLLTNTYNMGNIISISYNIAFPTEIDHSTPSNLVNLILLKEILSKSIQFKFSSIECFM